MTIIQTCLRQVAAAEERHSQLEMAHKETQQIYASLEVLKQDLSASKSTLMAENLLLSSERSELQVHLAAHLVYA